MGGKDSEVLRYGRSQRHREKEKEREREREREAIETTDLKTEQRS
jgi:hypothetical protein